MSRTAPMQGRRTRRRPMSEINVVPYIDVMLVLLVIFMVTAPLLYQGVEIELPESTADPLPPDDREPVIVEVDKNGRLYLSVGDQPDDTPIRIEEIIQNVAAIMRAQPDTPVYVRGDAEVPYARVMTVMTALQQAGVPQVGLMTQPPAGGFE
ncbi:protein TolR [Spiribacter salilacus]